jgi:hypothetical protein
MVRLEDCNYPFQPRIHTNLIPDIDIAISHFKSPPAYFRWAELPQNVATIFQTPNTTKIPTGQFPTITAKYQNSHPTLYIRGLYENGQQQSGNLVTWKDVFGLIRVKSPRLLTGDSSSCNFGNSGDSGSLLWLSYSVNVDGKKIEMHTPIGIYLMILKKEKAHLFVPLDRLCQLISPDEMEMVVSEPQLNISSAPQRSSSPTALDSASSSNATAPPPITALSQATFSAPLPSLTQTSNHKMLPRPPNPSRQQSQSK